MLVPGRTFSSPAYRYGFQGQEKDDELKGEGNSLNYTFRMHDPRVGRFFAVDPLEFKYPYLTPYQFSSNTPIMDVELEGLESKAKPNRNELTNGEKFLLNSLEFFENLSVFTSNNKYKKDGNIEHTAINALEGVKSLYDITFEVIGVMEVAKYGIGDLDDGISFGKSKSIFNLYKAESSFIKTTLTVTNEMNLFQKIQTRKNFVLLKFASAIDKYGIDHINWAKKVFSQKIKGNNLNGNRIVQWRNPSNPNPSPFFTLENQNPNKLGIPKTHTKKYYVELDEEYDFLTSTANRVKAFSDLDPGVDGFYDGGGTQLYSPDAAKNARFIPAND
ncbi:RHS repeat domain-containing protein [Flavobacterium sp. N2270]|jgi:RHS repeat-associated protein|uniref:RHS repeat domain-containing protein n=1 Tax=Flavobacterium sp. N2270 TaxID=2986831 RepID=UPI0022241C54|nr:RHS repeat-associated core domain-containing protein [Flavobacterium sp. N2270]